SAGERAPTEEPSSQSQSGLAKGGPGFWLRNRRQKPRSRAVGGDRGDAPNGDNDNFVRAVRSVCLLFRKRRRYRRSMANMLIPPVAPRLRRGRRPTSEK